MARGLGRKPKKPKERTVQFWDAPEVRLMAEELIEANHPHLEGKGVRFVFCGKTPPGARGCKAGIAALLMGGLPLAMAMGLRDKQTTQEGEERIHVIRTVRPAWNNWDEPTRRQKLDHALAHCGINDKGGPILWLHDVEEFRSIVERHGLLSEELKKFGQSCAEAAAQLDLGLDGKPPFRESAEVLESRKQANGKNGKHTSGAEAVRELVEAHPNATLVGAAAAVPAGDR